MFIPMDRCGVFVVLCTILHTSLAKPQYNNNYNNYDSNLQPTFNQQEENLFNDLEIETRDLQNRIENIKHLFQTSPWKKFSQNFAQNYASNYWNQPSFENPNSYAPSMPVMTPRGARPISSYSPMSQPEIPLSALPDTDESNLINELPPNYSKTTTREEIVNGKAATVRETVRKVTDKNKKSFIHTKIIQKKPQSTSTSTHFRNSYASNNDDDMSNLYDDYSNEGNKITKRSTISQTKASPVIFPSQFNQFPESHQNLEFSNPKQTQSKDLKSVSYVYKNIGDSRILYSVSHSDLKSNDIKPSPLKPREDVPYHDLSRDTIVNPGASNSVSQKVVMTHPEAEIFDLGLVIKEVESRPTL